MNKTKAQLQEELEKALRLIRKWEAKSKARPSRTRFEEKTSLAAAILENIVEGTNMVRAADGVLLHVTAQFAKMFGYERGELIGRPVSILNAPARESPEEVAAQIIARLKSQGTWNGDILNRRKNGTEFWCHVHISSIKHPVHGDVWISIHEDISERKNAEAALRESEEKFRSLYDNSIDAILLTSPDGGILAANPTACRIFERTEEEIRRLGRSGIIDASDPRLGQAVEERARTGRFSGELTGLRKGGTKFPIEVSTSIFEDRQGQPRTSMVIRDISKRKRAEESLKAERKHLYDVLETLPAMICILTPDYRVAFANRSFREKFGESRGRRCYEFCFERTGPCEFCEAYEVLKTGKPHQWTLASADGSVIEVHDFPFIETDGSRAILEMDIDITDRVQAEEELRASHEQLQAHSAKLDTVREEEKAAIARGIHDDLGQRLTGLLMDVSLLGKKLPKNLTSLREKAESMAEEVTALIKTVRRISTELRPGILDDLGLVPAIEWLCGDFLGSHGIRCTLNIETKAVELDPAKAINVFRVVQEAFTNVVRHAKASLVTIELKERAGQYILKIEDNGRGIDPADIAKSSSLGFIGMKERARHLKGTIDISGVPGQRTSVILTFPKRTEPEEKP